MFLGLCFRNNNLSAQGIFYGGDGDGVSVVTYAQAYNPTSVFVYGGGNGDGVSFTNYTQAQNAQVRVVFSGGNGDGVSFTNYTQAQNAQVRVVFSGGNGDGVAIHDSLSYIPLGNFIFWRGTSSTSFNTTSNWIGNSVPGTNNDIAFASNASRDLLLDRNRSVGNVSFNGSGKKLVLANNTLTVNGEFMDADSFSYIQTSSTGTLKRGITASTSFTFPVGKSAYNPVTITNNTGATDTFNVRVGDSVLLNATSGAVVSEPHIRRTWFIDKKNSNTGSGVNFLFRWNAAEVTSGFGSPALYHYNGSSWQKQTGTTSSTIRTFTFNGYTGGFSPFSIGDDIVLLPITWLDFQCAYNNNTVQLQWNTAMEQNSRRFWVERSAEGKNYQSIAEIPAAGYSNTIRKYTFHDAQPLPQGAYYRIKMEDASGNFSYSEYCVSKSASEYRPAQLKLYPNPAGQQLYMAAVEPERNFEWEVFSVSGKRVAAGISKDGKAVVRLQSLSEGVYHVKVTGSSLSENHRVLIKR